MKKILILTIALVSLFSCSDDDKNDDDKNLDPFVGTWHLYSNKGVEVSECESKSFIDILENGSFISIEFDNDNDKNECNADDDVEEGTWSNSGNNIYSIMLKGNNTPSEAHITFKDNNNTFVMIYLGKDGEYTAGKSTYKRK